MARSGGLPGRAWEAIFDKLDILAAQDHHVEALTPYQYRIDRRIDVYVVNRKWHDLRTGKRGTYRELVSFIKSHNMSTEPTLSELSGENTYRAPRSLEVNELSLNGDADVKEIAPGKFERKGGYFRKRILAGRTNRDEKPEEVNLGRTVKVVFLKIRRRLVERADKGEIIRSTSEHNSKTDAVTLFDSRTKQSVRGIAEDLRKVHEGLRTVQVVYALLLGGTGEPELVRITIKGASLGSEAKAEGVPTFYQYISSFPREAHMWEYVTELSAVVEEGAKTYFAINFQQGAKLDHETLALAEAKLREVAQNCRDVDEARAAKIVQSAKVEIATPAAGEEGPGIEYPKDDIDPADIPF